MLKSTHKKLSNDIYVVYINIAVESEHEVHKVKTSFTATHLLTILLENDGKGKKMFSLFTRCEERHAGL